jgi:hypothetical protein
VHFVSFFSGGFITAIVVKSTGKETGKTHLCAVAGRGKISEPITTETSKLDWRCFEYYYIDRNEFYIRLNFRKINKK